MKSSMTILGFVSRKTSFINGKKYLPWLDVDIYEKFGYLDVFR